jgi:hypothetical protein
MSPPLADHGFGQGFALDLHRIEAPGRGDGVARRRHATQEAGLDQFLFQFLLGERLPDSRSLLAEEQTHGLYDGVIQRSVPAAMDRRLDGAFQVFR